MAATDVERLAVLIEANTRSYERAMRNVEQRTQRAMGRSTRNVKQLDNQMKASALTAQRFMAAFGIGVGIAGLTKIARDIRSIVAETSEIGKVADRVGLLTTELQELRHAASLAGVEQGRLDNAMEQFARRIGEASQGRGELVRILEANNIQLRDEHGNMRSLNDLLRDYAELVRRAGSAQERATLAQEGFGRSGLSMVNVLKDGAVALDEARQEARDLGAVLSDELVRSAERVDDEFTKLGTRFRVRFRSDVLTAIDVLRDFRNEMSLTGSFAKSLGNFLVDTFGFLEDAETRARGSLRAGLLAARGRDPTFDMTPFEALRAGAGGGAAEPATVLPTRGDRASGRAGAASAIDKQREKVRELIADLEHELRVMGLSEEQRRVENALRQAGSAATEEQRAKIEELTRTIHQQEQAQEALNERMAFFGDIAESSLSAVILSGRQAEDVMADLARQLARAAIQATLLGKGPLAGLLGATSGGLFAGFFSQGGNIPRGRFGVVGERGPEIVRGPAAVTPMRGANANQKLDVTVSVDPSGNLQAFVTDTAGRVVARAAPQIAGAAVRQTQRSFGGMAANFQARQG